MKPVYFRSFGKRKESLPLETSILDPISGTRLTCQTLSEVLKHRIIRPNTRHHSLKDRLSASLPTQGFPGTYRPQGILFTTEQRPDYCVPFDLMALTYGKTFTSQDYGSDFLPGHERFVFPDFEAMEEQFPNSREALEALNTLREAHGLAPLDRDRIYNEVCFEDAVGIQPVALVGTSPELIDLSRQHRIKRYGSMDGYLRAAQRKRDIRDSLAVGLPATIAASVMLAIQALMPQEVQDRAVEPLLVLDRAYFQK